MMTFCDALNALLTSPRILFEPSDGHGISMLQPRWFTRTFTRSTNREPDDQNPTSLASARRLGSGNDWSSCFRRAGMGASLPSVLSHQRATIVPTSSSPNRHSFMASLIGSLSPLTNSSSLPALSTSGTDASSQGCISRRSLDVCRA